MKKKYKINDKSQQNNVVQEPAIPYGNYAETDMELSPPLTEEELKNLLTKEELLERVIPRIKKFFE